MTMKLKTVEVEGATYAEVQDGKPVYIADDGKEVGFDVPEMASKIRSLNHEAQTRREALQDAEAKLQAFEDLDPEAARKALETMQGLEGGKLLDAEKAAAERASAISQATKDFAAKLSAAEKRAEKAEQTLNSELIGGNFSRSKFIADKIAVPAPMVEKFFGDSFAVEGGKVVAKDSNGQPMYSRSNPGEYASFDEALELLVGQSPYRDDIMKGTGSSGSGASGGNGGSHGGKGTMTRRQFEEVQQSDPARAMKMMTEDNMVITD